MQMLPGYFSSHAGLVVGVAAVALLFALSPSRKGSVTIRKK
jgi:hypothetical protein